MWPKAHAATLAFTLLLACAPAVEPGHGDTFVCPSGLPSDSDCAEAAPSYEAEIQPLVDARCGGCHYDGNRNSEQVLETYDDLHSALSVVEKEVYRCEMPPSGELPLPAKERETLLKWLVCGAPH